MSAPAAAPLQALEPKPMPSAPRPLADDEKKAPWMRIGVVLGLAALLLVSYFLDPTPEISDKEGVVMKLPAQVSEFLGMEQPMTEVEMVNLPTDTLFTRRQYSDLYGNRLLATIILSGAEQRSIHRPEVCLDAQGWSIDSSEDVPVQLKSGHTMEVRTLHVSRNVQDGSGQKRVRALFVYWFIGEEITTPSHLTRVLLSGWDRLAHGRAHRWAYTMVFMPVTSSFGPGGLDDGQALQVITKFIADAVPSFQKSEMPAPPAVAAKPAA